MDDSSAAPAYLDCTARDFLEDNPLSALPRREAAQPGPYCIRACRALRWCLPAREYIETVSVRITSEESRARELQPSGV